MATILFSLQGFNVPSDRVPSLPQSGPRRDGSPDISPSLQIGLSHDEIQLYVANQWIAAPRGPIMVAFSGVHRPNGITNGATIFSKHSINPYSIHRDLQTSNSTGSTTQVSLLYFNIYPIAHLRGEISDVSDKLKVWHLLYVCHHCAVCRLCYTGPCHNWAWLRAVKSPWALI